MAGTRLIISIVFALELLLTIFCAVYFGLCGGGGRNHIHLDDCVGPDIISSISDEGISQLLVDRVLCIPFWKIFPSLGVNKMRQQYHHKELMHHNNHQNKDGAQQRQQLHRRLETSSLLPFLMMNPGSTKATNPATTGTKAAPPPPPEPPLLVAVRFVASAHVVERIQSELRIVQQQHHQGHLFSPLPSSTIEILSDIEVPAWSHVCHNHHHPKDNQNSYHGTSTNMTITSPPLSALRHGNDTQQQQKLHVDLWICHDDNLDHPTNHDAKNQKNAHSPPLTRTPPAHLHIFPHTAILSTSTIDHMIETLIQLHSSSSSTYFLPHQQLPPPSPYEQPKQRKIRLEIVFDTIVTNWKDYIEFINLWLSSSLHFSLGHCVRHHYLHAKPTTTTGTNTSTTRTTAPEVIVRTMDFWQQQSQTFQISNSFMDDDIDNDSNSFNRETTQADNMLVSYGIPIESLRFIIESSSSIQQDPSSSCSATPSRDHLITAILYISNHRVRIQGNVSASVPQTIVINNQIHVAVLDMVLQPNHSLSSSSLLQKQLDATLNNLISTLQAQCMNLPDCLYDPSRLVLQYYNLKDHPNTIDTTQESVTLSSPSTLLSSSSSSLKSLPGWMTKLWYQNEIQRLYQQVIQLFQREYELIVQTSLFLNIPIPFQVLNQLVRIVQVLEHVEQNEYDCIYRMYSGNGSSVLDDPLMNSFTMQQQEQKQSTQQHNSQQQQETERDEAKQQHSQQWLMNSDDTTTTSVAVTVIAMVVIAVLDHCLVELNELRHHPDMIPSLDFPLDQYAAVFMPLLLPLLLPALVGTIREWKRYQKHQRQRRQRSHQTDEKGMGGSTGGNNNTRTQSSEQDKVKGE